MELGSISTQIRALVPGFAFFFNGIKSTTSANNLLANGEGRKDVQTTTTTTTTTTTKTTTMRKFKRGKSK